MKPYSLDEIKQILRIEEYRQERTDLKKEPDILLEKIMEPVEINMGKDFMESIIDAIEKY